MIFVSVGTNEWPFDRLIEAVARLEIDDEIVVQKGSSKVQAPSAIVHDYLPFESMVEHICAARAVVTHAGVGSVMTALANGKQPIVVARLARFHEAVDDHQLWFARRLASAGLVEPADCETLADALVSVKKAPPRLAGPDSTLALELRSYIDACLSRRASAKRRQDSPSAVVSDP